jgi:phosphatidylcholine synthase
VFVHPVRVKRWRPMTMLVLALWSLAAFHAILVERLAPGFWSKAVLLVGAVYFLGLGFLRDLPERE